jgi:hypothetical protein
MLQHRAPARINPDGLEIQFGGVSSIHWETADGNANYLAVDLPAGGGVDVPVVLAGIGIDAVDLGLFNGVAQPTLGVVDADRDTALVLDFSADDAARIRTTAGALTLSPTTDTIIAAGTGLVMGHTANVALSGNGSEFQMHGTGYAAVTQNITLWGDNGFYPGIHIGKSRSGSTGTFGSGGAAAALHHGDTLFSIETFGDDGTQALRAARITISVDNAGSADATTNKLGTKMAFSTTTWDTSGTSTSQEKIAFTIDYQQNIDFNNNPLLNVGNANSDWDSTSMRSAVPTIWNTSADSASVTDQVSIGQYEIGAGNIVLALSQETAIADDNDESKFAHKLQVRINGSTYFLMLTAT